jgi:hypothetical protein
MQACTPVSQPMGTLASQQSASHSKCGLQLSAHVSGCWDRQMLPAPLASQPDPMCSAISGCVFCGPAAAVYLDMCGPAGLHGTCQRWLGVQLAVLRCASLYCVKPAPVFHFKHPHSEQAHAQLAAPAPGHPAASQQPADSQQ